MLSIRRCALALSVTVLAGAIHTARADVRLPALFTDHMVLQRDAKNSVWGQADAGESVTVSIADHSATTTADDKGAWRVSIGALPAGGPHALTVKGKNTVTIEDVLVGEVWVCSGQSNMGWTVNGSRDAALEIMTSNYPRIRLITVPRVGTQEPQSDFNGAWQLCGPETVGSFTAVGYFFGSTVHRAIDVPVGLINCSWGGSACEAWVSRDRLMPDVRYGDLLERWAQTEKSWDEGKVKAQHEERMAKWREKAAAAKAAGKPVPRKPRVPRNPLGGQHRPANLYNGMLKPLLGYGIRGAIWYQGESNANRAYQYRHLFPLMIQNWRDDWGIGDFPFYWVQLADFMAESPLPKPSGWAELREAQTMTLSLPNSGQAVIIDIGEGNDIHPKNKQDVGKRLARIALARDYGVKIAYQSALLDSLEITGAKAVVTLKDTNGGLRTVDTRDVRGFAIAGEDKVFVNAQARILDKNRVEVWSDAVKTPVAVRYAWADNPVCNLYDRELLPVTPFRTDDWPGVTVNNTK